ncbi:MAG: hypothetical protein DRN17_08165 [Thermoplasmata archaeon]|nr:MAG: hypothetical protein DRN17_08165 [Thermoplasmata archaeon]
MKATIKVKLYPNHKKAQHLRQSLGNARFIWNKLLEKEIELYRKEKKFIWYFDMCREITKLREEYPFLKESSIYVLQQMARKLHFALKNFVKHKDMFDFPKFKKKSRYDGILIYPKDFKITSKAIYLPKMGWVRFRDKIVKKPQWNEIVNTAKQIWVKEEADGFFAYIQYEKNPEPKPSNGKVVGIDVGIRNTVTLSNGEVYKVDKEKIMRLIEISEYLQSIIDKKREINKKRGIKFSRRLEYLKRKRLKILKKIRNIYQDFYYKISNHILNSHEYVVIEDLNLAELMQIENEKAEKNIHKHLQHIAIGRFFSILEYKAQLYGRKVVKVEPKDTSKTCSNCGYVYHELKLSDKTFRCPKCGFRIDRDLNASVNILKRGLGTLSPSAGQVEYRREMARFIPCLYAEPPSL